MRPKTAGILESSLYVADVAASVRFYESMFGFTVIGDLGLRGCAMQAGERQVLLLFLKSAEGLAAPPGPRLAHNGDGELHIAFAISASDLAPWELWLTENAVPVEEKRSWELGGHSLYFRDPDRHLIELATPGLWTIY